MTVASPEVPMKLQRWLDAALSDQEVGLWLRVYRKQLGVTAEGLAPYLNISRSCIAHRERGNCRWTPALVTETLNAIEKAAEPTEQASHRKG